MSHASYMVVRVERPILATDGLTKWYPVRGGRFSAKAYLNAVDGMTLSIRKGETLCLVGESGCGKTTFGRTIMRLTDPSGGSIAFDGEEISKLRGRGLKHVRRKMQMVFQDPYASLDPRQSVRSTLMEPMRIHNVVSSKAEAETLAEELIEKVGLNQDHLSRFPHEFSGGQRQRITIAAALAVKPTFMVLDEPTSSLDVPVQAQILRLLRQLQEEFELTYLFISHNMAVIRQVCDRTAVMYLGRMVELANTKNLFENPKHPYTKALLTSVPNPDPTRRRELQVLQGDVPSAVGIPADCRFRSRCSFATERCGVSPPLVEVEKDHWIECHYDIDFGAPAQRELAQAS